MTPIAGGRDCAVSSSSTGRSSTALVLRLFTAGAIHLLCSLPETQANRPLASPLSSTRRERTNKGILLDNFFCLWYICSSNISGEKNVFPLSLFNEGEMLIMSAQLGLAMLVVDDVPRCKAFYTELLGFEVVKEFSSDEFVFLHSSAGGTNLALQDASKTDYGIPLTRGGLALGFAVEDADATYQDWQSRSVEILGEVGDMGAGRMFAAKDPAGNYIQVYHLYPQVRDMQKQMGVA